MITVYIAMSLDGYIARKDDSLDWLERMAAGDEDYGFKKHLDSVDAIIMGRKTYGIASPSTAWPYTGKRTIVLSTTLQKVREGVEVYSGDLKELVKKLQAEGVRHIYIDGGVTISQFLALQMVDRMILSVIPIVLGSGIPLFHPMDREIPLRLERAQTFPTGLVQLNYIF